MVYCTVVPLTTASTQFTAAEFCPASNVAYGRSFSFWHVDSETRLGRRVEVDPFARLVSRGTRKVSVLHGQKRSTNLSTWLLRFLKVLTKHSSLFTAQNGAWSLLKCGLNDINC